MNMEYKCPVCGAEMSWRVCHWGKSLSKSGLILECPNPMHFRGFCNDKSFVSEVEAKGGVSEVFKARLCPAT